MSANAEAGSDNSLTVCDNFYVSDDGSLIKRQGITQYADAPGTLVNGATPIGIYDKIGISTHYIIVAGEPVSGIGHTYYVDTNGTFTELMFTDTSSAGSYSRKATSCAQLNGNLYLTLNETSAQGVWKWTGTGAATFITASPNIDGIVAYVGRLFGFSKATGAESRVHYTDTVSTVGDGWPSGFYFDVNPGDGDYVTCLLTYKDRLIIFKNNAIWQWFINDAPATWVGKLFHPSLGTFNKFSAEIYKNSYYFVHNSGVYSCDGTQVVELSVPIRAIFQPLQLTGYISVNRSWLYIGGIVSGKALVYKLDSEFKAWTTMSTPMFTDVNNILPSRAQGTSTFENDGSAKAYDTTKIYIGANNGIYVLNQVDPLSATYTDIQARPSSATYPVTCQFTTKAYNIGRLSRLKRNKYSYIYVEGKGSSITYSYLQDNTTIVGNVVVGADNFIEVYRIKGAQYFRVLQLQVVESSANPFLFMGFSFVIMLQRQAASSVIG